SNRVNNDTRNDGNVSDSTSDGSHNSEPLPSDYANAKTPDRPTSIGLEEYMNPNSPAPSLKRDNDPPISTGRRRFGEQLQRISDTSRPQAIFLEDYRKSLEVQLTVLREEILVLDNNLDEIVLADERLPWHKTAFDACSARRLVLKEQEAMWDLELRRIRQESLIQKYFQHFEKMREFL
ncbi:hypothetical protein BGX21_007122, partial [Mortierella sp. AD011]